MRANKVLLLISSVGTLAALLWAAWEESNAGWRHAQRKVGGSLQLRQIVVPELRVADRCVSCHVGMAAGETGIAGDPIYGAHPDVVHDPASFGCTVCHGGQGRATTKEDAHGTAEHWPEPMLPSKYAYAGCGACHTHLSVPSLAVLERGRALFEQRDCYSCHRVDKRGGTLRRGGVEAPDLSRVGARGVRDWYPKHLQHGEIPEDERSAIEVFLSSRVGAPGLVESKALFHSLGCRGCHKLGGVGGDDGPDLTRAGQRDPGLTSFVHVPGTRTLENWWKEHFRAPATVVPGSAMPLLGLSEKEIEGLAFYLHSLRRSAFPESFWPKDRVRAERFGEREFTSDGATLFGTFCAACHGPSGEGRRYPGMAAFPAIGSPDFLRLASDAFLAQTILHGRVGRRMPAWGESESGLKPADVDAVIAHLRKLGGADFEGDDHPPRWVNGNVQRGSGLYAANCAGCHGDRGQGFEGPALANAQLQRNATDGYLVKTILRGRRGTSMEGFDRPSPVRRALTVEEIQDIVTFIRTWERKS